MHEWALAEAVVQTVLEVAGKEKLTSVDMICISIGELQGIEKEIFEFALEELMKNKPIFKKTVVSTRYRKTMLRCRACGEEWTLDKSKMKDDEREAVHFIPEIVYSIIRCPRCRSPDFEIVGGRGLSIDRIEGSKNGGSQD